MIVADLTLAKYLKLSLYFGVVGLVENFVLEAEQADGVAVFVVGLQSNCFQRLFGAIFTSLKLAIHFFGIYALAAAHQAVDYLLK